MLRRFPQSFQHNINYINNINIALGWPKLPLDVGWNLMVSYFLRYRRPELDGTSARPPAKSSKVEEHEHWERDDLYALENARGDGLSSADPIVSSL